MRLTKSQIEYLAKEARNGRLYVGTTDKAQPAWLLLQLSAVMKEMTRILSIMELSDFYESETKSKVARYSEGNKRGWVTKKRQARARAAQAEAHNTGERNAA